MTDKEIYVAVGIALFWITLSVYASIRAKRHFTASKKRLIFNQVLIWVIPLIWALLIITISRKTKHKKKDGYKYHESGYSNYTKWGG